MVGVRDRLMGFRVLSVLSCNHVTYLSPIVKDSRVLTVEPGLSRTAVVTHEPYRSSSELPSETAPGRVAGWAGGMSSHVCAVCRIDCKNGRHLRAHLAGTPLPLPPGASIANSPFVSVWFSALLSLYAKCGVDQCNVARTATPDDPALCIQT